MKILIDTNIYLDFYRSNVQPVNIFNTLKEFNSVIILTDQIIQEFERSREGVIKSVRQKFELESKLDNFSSSYLQELDEFKELVRLQKEYRAKQKEVILRIEEILRDPSKDPIAVFFKDLVNDSIEKNTVWRTTDEIINKASRRKKTGNPPTSDRYSIGDEINWEIVLDNIKEDIIIVGRDNTYRDNLAFLQKDMSKNTGFFIHHLTDSITDALIKGGFAPSEQTIEEEIKFIETIRHYNDFWKRQDE